jgi:hypothetical protein
VVSQFGIPNGVKYVMRQPPTQVPLYLFLPQMTATLPFMSAYVALGHLGVVARSPAQKHRSSGTQADLLISSLVAHCATFSGYEAGNPRM